MTVELEEFTQWRDSVEARLGKLESVSDEHAEERQRQLDLFASMDADLSRVQVEFRAQRGMLQALHLTQNEHTATLRDHTATLRDHTATLRDHTATLRDHTARLVKLEAGQAKVLAGVNTIIGLLSRADDDGEPVGGSPN